MRQRLFAAVAIALVASPVCAQPAGSAPSLDHAFGQLERLELTAAERSFAAVLGRADLTSLERAKALRGLGASIYDQNRPLDAAAPFAQALESAEASGDRSERGWARRWLGTLQYGKGNADQAKSLWNSAREDFVASGDRLGEFEVLDDLALLVEGLQMRPLAERCYEIAVELDMPLLEARARRKWGQALLSAALAGPALVELERAVALMRPLGPRAQRYLGDALAILGWALRVHGAHERAVAVHREAIRVAIAAGDLNAQVWKQMGLGASFAMLRRNDEAEVAMRRGLEAARLTGSATSIRILTESLGWISVMRGDWRRAAGMLETALSMPGVDVTVTPLINLARAYRGLKRYDDALTTATRALELTRSRGLVDNELRVLVELAQIHEARGDLDQAQATLQGVIDRLESYRAKLAPVDFLKQGFGENFSDAYGASVELLMRRDRPAEALTAAERVRSRAFADLLASRRLREADDAAAESGAWTLGGGIPAPSLAGVSADSVRALPAKDAAALGALAGRLSTTIVVYWVNDRGSYVWVIKPDGGIHATTIAASPRTLQRAVRRAADDVPDVSLAGSAATVATASSDRDAYRALYRMLWAPLEPWLPRQPDARITIVPHGPLFALPFGALLDSRGRYVVERYALHYAASGAVLDQATSIQRPADGVARELIVADPSPLPRAAQGTSLPTLNGARAEARAIATLFAGHADLLVGPRASESAVRAGLGDARVLHFATHAIVTDTDPLGSHLMLGAASAAGAGVPASDGRLTASEVAGLSLAADLVVLGACRSARGPVSSDGIAGLTRAFMAAGAPSVVATLWDVSDQTTARVMTRFYAGYVTGISKDRALRAAQLDLLRDLRNGKVRRTVGDVTVTFAEHPHLWAGTILVGAP